MLSKRLGINYKTYNLIANKKDQNKEFGELCRFIPFFMHNLWENPESLAIILSNLNRSDSEIIANFIAHNLYENIFSSNKNEEQLIYLITLLLKEEMKKLKDDKIDLSKFLHDSSVEYILKEFILKKDVQSFFKENLVEIIKTIEMETSHIPMCFSPNIIAENIYKFENSNKDNNNKESTINSDMNKTIKNKAKMNLKIEKFNKEYLKPLELKDFNNALKNYNNKKEMKEFLEKKILDCQSNPKLYSTDKIIAEIYGYKESGKIFLYYISSFMEAINIINMIINNLLINSNSLPYSIKCICKIISILIEKKYPKENKVEQNAFLAKFIFQMLIFPIFKDPSLHLLINEYLISYKTMDKLRIIEEILNEFSLGQLFSDKTTFLPFNNYFIEKMPDLIEIFNNICQVTLPSFIDKLLNNQLPENYKYDYFKENSNENIFYRNICFNFDELYILIINSISFKDKISLDKTVISRLESKKDKLEELKKAADEKETNYFLLTDYINTEKYQKILDMKKDKEYFSLKEFKKIEDEEQNSQNNIIKIKNFFFALLYNYPTLLKNNYSERKLSKLINLLKELKNNSYINSSNYTSKQRIPYKWYLDSIIQYLPRLPYELKEKNYNGLLTELENEINNSIKNYNFNLLTEFTEYIKEMKKEKFYYENTKNIILDIDNNKMVHNIIEKDQIPVELIFNEKELTISPTEIKTKRFLFFPVKKSNIICETIKSFLNQFPNIKDESNIQKKLDLFECIKYFKIPESLDNYLNIIKEYLKEKKNINDNKKLEQISNKIYDYILENLNNKLYPDEPDKLDEIISKNCINVVWIDPSNLIKTKKNYVFDTYLPDAINYFQNIDKEKSPRKKLLCIKQIYTCIYNLGKFNEDKIEGADDEMPLLNYTFIKANPKNIYTNCKYIQLFLGDKQNKQEGNFITKILSICEKMAKFTYKDLYNMTESDFIFNCDLVKKGILY